MICVPACVPARVTQKEFQCHTVRPLGLYFSSNGGECGRRGGGGRKPPERQQAAAEATTLFPVASVWCAVVSTTRCALIDSGFRKVQTV